jgi:hypothetical protein
MPSWAINSTKLSNYKQLIKMVETLNNAETAQLGIGAVSSSGFLSLSENRFRGFFEEFGNAAERYENGKKVVVYTLHRKIDNNFNLSYHLEFPQKKVKFNFWFEKISYLNSKESVTISFHNSNEPLEKNRLKNVLTTNCLNELKSKVNEVFTQYR